MGRVRRAWRKGVRRNRRFTSLTLTPARTWRMWAGRGASRRLPLRRELPGRVLEQAREATGKVCAYLWRGRRDTAGLLLRRANDSEHGNRPAAAPGGGHPARRRAGAPRKYGDRYEVRAELANHIGAPIPAPGRTTRRREPQPGRFPCSLSFARRRRSPAVSRRPRHRYAADFPCGLPGLLKCPARKFPLQR